jgi:hypothetical protein
MKLYMQYKFGLNMRTVFYNLRTGSTGKLMLFTMMGRGAQQMHKTACSLNIYYRPNTILYFLLSVE